MEATCYPSHAYALVTNTARCLHEQVVIRVRPPLPRELQALHPYENTVAVDAAQRVVTLSENLASLQGGSGPAGTASVDNGMVIGCHRRPWLIALCLTCQPRLLLEPQA